MQTFAPEGTNILKGFLILDRQRLGKQRVETWQILRFHVGLSDGWGNHPATKMWDGYVPNLAYYGLVNCHVWKSRGYKDSLEPKFLQVLRGFPGDWSPPDFLDDIAESHRSNLIRKDPEYYRPVWPDTPDDIPYLWPKE